MCSWCVSYLAHLILYNERRSWTAIYQCDKKDVQKIIIQLCSTAGWWWPLLWAWNHAHGKDNWRKLALLVLGFWRVPSCLLHGSVKTTSSNKRIRTKILQIMMPGTDDGLFADPPWSKITKKLNTHAITIMCPLSPFLNNEVNNRSGYLGFKQFLAMRYR